MGMATYFISIPEYYDPYFKRVFMMSSNKKDEEKEDEENVEDADVHMGGGGNFISIGFFQKRF